MKFKIYSYFMFGFRKRKEKKLEKQIFEILCKYNPFGYEKDYQKEFIYTYHANVFLQELKSINSADELQDAIYNFLFNEVSSDYQSFKVSFEDVSKEEDVLEEVVSEECCEQAVAFIGHKDNYKQIAEEIFTLKLKYY